MADIELVINISEKLYEDIKKHGLCGYCSDREIVSEAIASGMPLPKGHGRILDEKDILDTKNNDGGWYDLVDMPEYIAGVKAIIDADKEQEE